jgi:outer membrane protein assembly factor BamA
MKQILTLFFLMTPQLILGSQFNIKEIKINGLKKTNLAIIRNEFALNLEEPTSQDEIDEGIRRLKNTNLFSDISYKIENEKLILNLKERWTTIPVLKFASGGGVTQTTLGVYDPNSFGDFLELGGQYQRLGETNSGVLWFKNPRLFGKRQGLDLQFWKTARLRTKYNQDAESPIEKAGFLHLRDQIYLGYFKEINNQTRLDISYEYHSDSFSNKIVPESIKNTGTNLLPPSSKFHFIGGEITLGRINYDQHLVDGSQLEISTQFGLSELNSSKHFISSQVNGRYFKTISKNHTFAQRLLLGATSTETIQYWFYLGGLDRIRGFVDNRFADRIFWLSNTEYRYAFWKNSWMTLQSVAFLDLLDSQEQLSDGIALQAASTGVGLRFFFPKIYRFVARFDYAKPIKRDDNNAISFGVQQFF